jgi:LysR family glycine cleavage system transcriptional activator
MNGSRKMRLNSTALGTLRFFDAAARHLNFSRAAAELSITQGAVSHQVKYLEEFLGCKLFYRIPKQVKLTEEGAKFAKVVADSLRALDQGAEAALNASRSLASIRLRAGPSFVRRWLVPRLGRLQSRCANIRLHVIADYGYSNLVERSFDLAVELVEQPPRAFQAELLMAESLTPVCSPEYRAKYGPLHKPTDLARCTLLHDGDAWEFASEDAEWRHWLNEVGAGSIDSSQGHFFSLSDAALEAALAHQGVAMGRRALVQELLDSGRLVAPFPQRVQSPTGYCLVYPKELANRSDVQEVAQWLREEATQPNVDAGRGRKRSGAYEGSRRWTVGTAEQLGGRPRVSRKPAAVRP